MDRGRRKLTHRRPRRQDPRLAHEARWYKFPVVPGQTRQGDTAPSPSQDYDLAVYGDIGKAFQRLHRQRGPHAAGGRVRRRPRRALRREVPVVRPPGHGHPRRGPTPPSATFAPRVYAPRVYAPRVYAPRVYAPRVYAPRVYAPRVYAPNSYAPDLQADPGVPRCVPRQRRTRPCWWCRSTPAPGPRARRRPTVSTGNNQGYFYVRVQGHDDQAFDTAAPFHLGLEISGIHVLRRPQHLRRPLRARPHGSGDASTVIVTDTQSRPASRRRSRPSARRTSTRWTRWPRRSGRRRRRRQRISPRVAGAAGPGRRAHHDCPYADEPGRRARSRTSSTRYRGDARA